MGLEELFAWAVRLLGPSVVHNVLSRLVEGASGDELQLGGSCREPFDAFDCDELGIYTDED